MHVIHVSELPGLKCNAYIYIFIVVLIVNTPRLSSALDIFIISSEIIIERSV